MTTPVIVTRHRCDHCNRSWSSKTTATRHEVRCWSNPAMRHCRSCINWSGSNTFGTCDIGAAPALPHIFNNPDDDGAPEYMQVAECPEWRQR